MVNFEDTYVNIEDLINNSNDSDEYLFGFIEELNSYVFGVYYRHQNVYSINNTEHNYGNHEKLIVNLDERYSDCFHFYIMKDSILSVTTWDYVSPFESDDRKTYVIDTEVKTIVKNYN